MKDKPQFKGNETLARAAMAVAWVAAIFVLALSVLLILNYVQIKRVEPIENEQLNALRQQFADAPNVDPELADQIRVLDFMVRNAVFNSQRQLKVGGFLLLAGAIVFLIALKLAGRWRPELPHPGDAPEAAAQWAKAKRAREITAFTCLGLVVLALLAAHLTTSELNAVRQPPAVMPPPDEAAAPEAPAFPTWEEMCLQWPSFRGPGGMGVAYHTNIPRDWEGKTLWSVEVPMHGFNSPVIWDNKLYVSGADIDKREVYCYNTENGELLWQQTLPSFPGSPAEPLKVDGETGYAAPTMAVQGDYVCAVFANGDLACYDSTGTMRWGKNVGIPDNHYGHSSSLLAYENLLFVQFDDRKNPHVEALHLETGEVVWTAQRDKISWASPALAETPKGMQLLLNNEIRVDAYAPLTGDLLWQVECLDGEVAPSPFYHDGMVFVGNEYASAAGIKLDMSGETITGEVAWEYDDYLPEVSSPVGDDKYFYLATSIGEIVCLDRESGEEVWYEEFDNGFYASLLRVGEEIFAIDRDGIAYFIKGGPEGEIVTQTALELEVSCTPALLDNRVYIRTEDNHLLCIGGAK